MGEVQRDVQAALVAIESANLTPTEHTLLEQFINGAVDSAYAARFVLRWINNNDHGSVQSALQNLKQSLRELSTICELSIETPRFMQGFVFLIIISSNSRGQGVTKGS